MPHGDNNMVIPIKNERQIANPNHDQLGTPSKLSLLNKITKANSTLHPSTESKILITLIIATYALLH